MTKLDILVVTRKTQVSKEIQTEFTVMTDEATDIERLIDILVMLNSHSEILTEIPSYY